VIISTTVKVLWLIKSLFLLSTSYHCCQLTRGNACLDKKNPCGDNNQEPDDLSFHISNKKGIVLEL